MTKSNPQTLSSSQQQEASEHLSHIAETGNFNLSASDFQLLKQHLKTDPFDFARVICNYTIINDTFHRPLAYILGQCVDKLVALLNNPTFSSFVLSALRVELQLRGIDWNSPQGRAQLAELLRFINIRFYRGSAKSSLGTHSTLLWFATNDPNETIALMTVNDDGAHAFCRQIRDTLQSDLYRLFFPERIPEGDLSKLWTEQRLWLGGRTISHPQWTIEARGFTSSWARTHFNRFFTDDIVTEANCSPTELAKVHRNLGNMRGLYMPELAGRPVARHHLGTVYDEMDDHWFLRKIKHCLTLVMPIEVYPNGMPETITERGIPTNPEWHPLSEIEKICEEVSGDPKQGPLSYKRNFWLDPTAGVGDRLFSPNLVEKSKYRLVEKSSVRYAVRKRIVKEQLEDYFCNPFREMGIVLGIDPAFSAESTADLWAITALGTDFEEVHYQLETVAGQGFENLKAHMRAMILRWKPRAVGYERAGAQEQNFKTLLEYDRFFRRYATIFTSVSHENNAKDTRLINQVRDPMTIGKLLLCPEAHDLLNEMMAYVPGPRAKDNRIDSLAIAMSVARRGRGKADVVSVLEKRNRELKQKLSASGVRIK